MTFAWRRPPGRPPSVRDGSCDDAAMRRRSVFARAGWVAGPLVIWLVAAPSVAAHGTAPAEPPTLANLLLGWTWEPLPTLAIGVSLAWWWWAVRRVNAAHPGNPVPRRRSVAFGAAMLALAFALISGIERYDTTLFSVHMVQHILLMLVAAPLIALAAPITLILRVSSSKTRKDLVLPVLHSRVMRVLAFPVVAWLIFAVVMWVSHFSPLFNAALEDPFVHTVEHAIFLASALLFWWPAVGARPRPMADGPSGTAHAHLHADDAEHLPRGRDPLRLGRALPALRDRSSATGGRRRWTTSDWPPASCGSSAT